MPLTTLPWMATVPVTSSSWNHLLGTLHTTLPQWLNMFKLVSNAVCSADTDAEIPIHVEDSGLRWKLCFTLILWWLWWSYSNNINESYTVYIGSYGEVVERWCLNLEQTVKTYSRQASKLVPSPRLQGSVPSLNQLMVDSVDVVGIWSPQSFRAHLSPESSSLFTIIQNKNFNWSLVDNYKTFGEKTFVSWWKIWQRKLLQNCLFVLPNNATPQIATFANSHAKVFCYMVLVLVHFDHWLSAGVEDYGLINTLGFVACLVWWLFSLLKQDTQTYYHGVIYFTH